MTVGTWSPQLETGIGYVRFDTSGRWLRKTLKLQGRDQSQHNGEVIALPFYDSDKKIPRGKITA